MPFSSFNVDDISVIKSNGKTIEGIKASVQPEVIFINRSDILIEPDDLIQRKMSNGGIETYQVIDPVFYEKFHGIAAHYQIKHRKLGLPEAKKAVQNITYNNTVTIHGDNKGNAQSGNGNTINTSEFTQKFIQLIQEIENSSIGNKAQIIEELNEKKEDSESLKPYLYSLLSVASDTASVVSVIGGLLGVIG